MIHSHCINTTLPELLSELEGRSDIIATGARWFLQTLMEMEADNKLNAKKSERTGRGLSFRLETKTVRYVLRHVIFRGSEDT